MALAIQLSSCELKIWETTKPAAKISISLHADHDEARIVITGWPWMREGPALVWVGDFDFRFRASKFT